MRNLNPHASVQGVMLQVWLATLPGFAALIYFWGWGHLIIAALAVTAAMASEALMLRLRRRPVRPRLQDGSAALTGWLLALCLPSLAPWWIPVVGASLGIILAKQLYGGLGQNPFNPAMVGYAICIVAFPLPMTVYWVALPLLDTPLSTWTLAWQTILLGHTLLPLDAMTMATPLDLLNQTRLGFMDVDLDGSLARQGWVWISALYALGGLALLWRRVIRWHIPTSILVSTAIFTLLLIPWAEPMPLDVQLLSGSLMLGAFFIATDPSSSPISPRAQWVYGIGIGLWLVVIRTWGGYPDGFAFAVLLMNLAVPLLDHWQRQRLPS